MRLRSVLGLVAVVASFSSPGSSLGSAAADEDVAKRHYLEGTKLYNGGKLAAAAEEFELAVKESPRAELFFNLARVYDKLQRPVKAVANYRRYLQTKIDAQDRASVEALIHRDLDLIGHVDLQVGPAGGEVKVDGELVGPIPLVAVVDMEPGVHKVEILRAGYQPQVMQVSVAGGQTGRVEISSVGTKVDGKAMSAAAAAATGGAKGAPEKAPGPAAATGGEHPRGQSHALAIGLLVGGAAALIAGIGLGAGALADASSVSGAASVKNPPPYASVAGQESQGRVLAPVGVVLDVVGAAALVADVVVWVVQRKEVAQ